ncbi:MAG: cytochrome B [Methylocystis sp.]|nr:MAG: cytochrome B [Methylocystis sp.]
MTTLEHDHLASAARYSKPARRKVWDWPTRFFHWSLVIAFVGAFVTNKLGASYFTYHLWCGYAVIILVVFRIVWGFAGTRHARFASFVQGPLGVLHYVSAAGRGLRTRYAGHNPLGGLMVLTLLFALGTQATLGLFGNDEIFNAGPLASLVSKQASLALTSLHRKMFYLIAAAVGLHIVAVIAHVVLKREPLIRAMFTGAKPIDLVGPEEAIPSSKGPLAAFLLIIIAATLAAALHFIPPVDIDLAGY